MKSHPIQFTVSVPEEYRVAGRLYDACSGVCMGLASDEDKENYAARCPFRRVLAGCPYMLVIWS